jgi:NADH-quinone oxidoreductase subunit J
MNWVFLILALPTVAAALAAVCLRNLIHAALCAAVCFTGVAALFVHLGAEFLGFAQVIVYVGAVAILVVFAISLTRGFEAPAKANARRAPWLAGVVAAALVFGLMAAAVVSSPSLVRPGSAAFLKTRQVGDRLLAEYVLPLEVMGLLLTAALVGSVVLALREPDRGKESRAR